VLMTDPLLYASLSVLGIVVILAATGILAYGFEILMH
jgi:hypothetical protein